MSEDSGPKFNCPACGKEYTWKPQLAGKKGKCKCGSVMVVPAKAPRAKVAVPEPEEDTYDIAGPSSEPSADADDMPVAAPPPYAPSAATTPPPYKPGASAAAAAVASSPASESGGRELRWAPARKWLGIGVLIGALAIWEFAEPTDPDSLTVRKWKLLLVIANKVHPHGGFFLLAAFAAFMLVVGVLILLGKAKDSDYEHEQEKDTWPASRARRR